MIPRNAGVQIALASVDTRSCPCPCPFHEGTWGSRGRAPLINVAPYRDEWSGQGHAPADFTPGKQP